MVGGRWSVVGAGRSIDEVYIDLTDKVKELRRFVQMFHSAPAYWRGVVVTCARVAWL